MRELTNFAYSERMLGLDSDNLIIYDAGPINISISGWSEEITIKTDERWEYLLEEVIEVVGKAWGVQDEDIIQKVNPIVIKLNYKILLRYIEHSIIFM